ncbi:hypothetical protein WJX74_001169 [Apatococcus lobatus]|uniref:Uncharacterized protein n=1 Tax=Apatococcus lobatus TaxID=904363 RepID=A0AAW1RP23_9CHLO
MVNTTALVSSEAVAAGKLVLSQAVPASARVRQVKGLSGADVIVTTRGHTTAFVVMQAADWAREDFMDRLEAFSRCFQPGKAYILSASDDPCDTIVRAACSFLEWQSCSLSSIPFSIQADQIVQHVIEVAEGLSQPNEADSLKDEHLAFLRAQGSLDSHCQTMLELASDRHYHASHQHNADQSLQDLARVLLAAQSTS